MDRGRHNRLVRSADVAPGRKAIHAFLLNPDHAERDGPRPHARRDTSIEKPGEPGRKGGLHRPGYCIGEKKVGRTMQFSIFSI